MKSSVEGALLANTVPIWIYSLPVAFPWEHTTSKSCQTRCLPTLPFLSLIVSCVPRSLPRSRSLGLWFRHLKNNFKWVGNINMAVTVLLYLINSVQLLSCVHFFVTPWTAAYQASLFITCSRSLANLCPLSWWCHPTISSSIVPFSSHPQFFPASGSFQMSQFFTSGGQSMQFWLQHQSFQEYSGLISFRMSHWISLQSKGCSRGFSNTTVQKHQFFGAQLSSPILTSIHDYWKNLSFDYMDLCWLCNVSVC